MPVRRHAVQARERRHGRAAVARDGRASRVDFGLARGGSSKRGGLVIQQAAYRQARKLGVRIA